MQILIGALSVLLGVWADLGALLLGAFLIPTAFAMHAFWHEPEPAARMTEQTQLVKDPVARRSPRAPDRALLKWHDASDTTLTERSG